MPRISVGRIVHFVAQMDGIHKSRCRPAVITDHDPFSPIVSLMVWSRVGSHYYDDVEENEDHFIAGTWHWPERMEP